MKVGEIINKDELYTISLYHGKSNYDSTLEVVSCDYESSQLRMTESNNSVLRVELDLAYGDLKFDLKGFDKIERCHLKWIDKSNNKELFKYKVENLDKIKEEICKYNNIRLWVDKNDSNSYLFCLFFCNEFYDEICNKNVVLANIDNFYKKSISLQELVRENLFSENILSINEIDNYKLKWDEQLEINSEIRDVSNGVINNLEYFDLHKPVLDIIKKSGRSNRMDIIHKLQESNLLNNGHPIIYNYIINRLILKNAVNSYMIKYSDDEDIDSNILEDEYRNNEIEYVGWRWCLVGNIVDKRIYGENHEIKYGTKHFSPGTKVYVAPHQWGDGGENLVVLGNPRNKKGLIECVIRGDYICNFRLKKIYPSSVLDRMDHSKYMWWGNDDGWKECIIHYAEGANKLRHDDPKTINNETKEEFLFNLDKLQLFNNSRDYIKNNLGMSNDNEIISYCRKHLEDEECNIYREGKNWYCENKDVRIVVNACSYAILSVTITYNRT